MFLYPKLSSREMVGTDLVQAIPLVASAALGHLIFGDLQFGLTASVLVGAIPGVYVGARISSTASDRFIRPALIAVLTISSLKLIGATNAFIRRPFLYYGALQGAAGGVVAWLIVSGGVWLVNHNLGELSHVYASLFQLRNLTPTDSAVAIIT